MTTQTESTNLSTEPAAISRRPPTTVIVASVLTVLVASVGTYGAVFFSGVDGYDAVDVTFISTYGYLALLGIVSAIAQLRGSALGRAGVLAWAGFGTMFTIMKLATIQETEAIAFGAVTLAVVILVLTPQARRFFQARMRTAA